MAFFNDGKTPIDYIIVMDPFNFPLIKEYLTRLTDAGLQYETVRGQEVPHLFVKIHAPKTALDHFSLVYDVGNEDQKEDMYKKKNYGIFNFMKTPISDVPPPQFGVFEDCQRIGIVNKILEATKFGEEQYQNGITKMVQMGVIITAYPLHSGGLEEVEGKPLNDRQLLLKYFANSRLWHKEMPLDKIKSYFGHEVAFYFAWVEFFDVMLIVPTVIGTIVTSGMIIALIVRSGDPVVKDICGGLGKMICAATITRPPMELKKYCFEGRMQYIFDNIYSIFFAVLMSVWATVFLNYWRRKESKLSLKWGVDYDLQESTIRPAYVQQMALDKKTKPKYYRIMPTFRMLYSLFVCFLLVMVVVIAVLVITAIKILLGRYFVKKNFANPKFAAMCVGCALQVTFIKIFGNVYGKTSLYLTNIENPRTQSQYDNSVLYKRYFLAFTNNYSGLFYVAFFRGRFYTRPHLTTHMFSIIQRDICDPISCIPALCIALSFLMIFKKLTGNFLTYLAPYTNMICKVICCKKVKIRKKKVPQWEEEFDLLPTNRFLLTTEFSEMIIQYGFVTFFVAALPLAPLFCLLNNLMEARLDAYKLVTRFRRPVPMKKSGVGAWNGVLLGLTFLSVTTNGFAIAFTSDIVPKEMYRMAKGSLDGYVNSTLSEFKLKGIRDSPDYCYYKCKRYPPTHKLAYEHTDEYWREIGWRLIVVFIFEHIMFVCTAVLDYAIPDVPPSVKMQVNKDKAETRNKKFEDLTQKTHEGTALGDIGMRLHSIVGHNLPQEENVNRRRVNWEDLPLVPPIMGYYTR